MSLGFSHSQKDISQKYQTGPTPSGQGKGWIHGNERAKDGSQKNPGGGDDPAFNGSHIFKADGQQVLTGNGNNRAPEQIFEFFQIRQPHLVKKQAENNDPPKAKHDKEGGLCIMDPPGHVQIHDGNRRTHPGSQRPKGVGVKVHICRR